MHSDRIRAEYPRRIARLQARRKKKKTIPKKDTTVVEDCKPFRRFAAYATPVACATTVAAALINVYV